MFLKREKKTGELTLSDFNSIWTKFCFLDETGSLSDDSNPYFTIGVLKLSQPYYLQSKLLYERSKKGFYDEMKFNKLSKNNIDFAKVAVDSIFDTKSTSFYSYTTRKDSKYFKEHFDCDQWLAYKKLTLKLLGDAVLSDNEILILLADHVTTPKDIRFEVDVKRELNSSEGRLALAGVCRFDSKSNDLLQLVDLVIGAITYDLKLNDGIVTGSPYKKALVEHIKSNLGASNFKEGFRNKFFNIFVEKDK